MLSKEMEKEINIQINKELYSAYLYMAMAAYFDNKNLSGFANFFQVQAQEEVFHAQKFYHYLFERGGRVVLEAIEKPQTDFKDVKAVFQQAYEHEQYVTSRINTLMNLAIKESDHASKAFLDWFISEQVEEEASMDSILQKIDLVGATGHGILMLDAQLGQRTYTPPASQE
ncbi:ferritin [candidate division KSB1 bacterium]|nr:ferritin [candidate division KSB1 bacterium]